MESISRPRTVCYYQTHFHRDRFVSILPLLTNNTGTTHVILAAIHLNHPPGNITLNDDPYNDPRLNVMYHEIRALQYGGIKVLGMLGGAHPGSFKALDGDPDSFTAFYEPLRRAAIWMGLDGLDLDVEEEMSLFGAIRLVNQLKADFGESFLVTLAPVATAMQGREHLSGFSYEDLEVVVGRHIAWYNTQFYCGWGDMKKTEGFELIAARGWDMSKIVIGLVTNPENGRGWISYEELKETMKTIARKYPQVGGFMGWEYFNSMVSTESEGVPWRWAYQMSRIWQELE